MDYLEYCVNKSVDFIVYLYQGNKINKERYKANLREAMNALAVTKSYVHQLKETGKRSSEKELEISNLWFSLSTEFYEIDEDMAEQFFVKGLYWTDPEREVRFDADQYKKIDFPSIEIKLQESLASLKKKF